MLIIWRHITPINDGGLENYVDNNLTLIEDEDLIDITEDFCQF